MCVRSAGRSEAGRSRTRRGCNLPRAPPEEKTRPRRNPAPGPGDARRRERGSAATPRRSRDGLPVVDHPGEIPRRNGRLGADGLEPDATAPVRVGPAEAAIGTALEDRSFVAHRPKRVLWDPKSMREVEAQPPRRFARRAARPGRLTAREALRRSWRAASSRVIGTPASFGRRCFSTRRRVAAASPSIRREADPRTGGRAGAITGGLTALSRGTPFVRVRGIEEDRGVSRRPSRKGPIRTADRPGRRGWGRLRSRVPRSVKRRRRRARVGFRVRRVSRPGERAGARSIGYARRKGRRARPSGARPTGRTGAAAEEGHAGARAPESDPPRSAVRPCDDIARAVPSNPPGARPFPPRSVPGRPSAASGSRAVPTPLDGPRPSHLNPRNNRRVRRGRCGYRGAPRGPPYGRRRG